MNKIFLKLKNYYLFNKNIIYIFVGILIISSLWINKVYYEGHDTISHFSNIYALSTTINVNNITGSRIYPLVAKGFGYGTGIFYPPLADYIPALIYKVTSLFSEEIFYSIKIYYFLVISLASITIYNLSYKIFFNKSMAVLSAVMYMFMPYFLSDIFVRDALGETLIFFVFPLSLLGLHELINSNYKKFLVTFIPAIVIGIHSHLVLMVYLSIFLVIFLIFNYRKVLDKSKLKYLLIAILAIISFSAPYLSRLITHRFNGNYAVFSENVMSTSQSMLDESLIISDYILQSSHHNNIWLCINLVTIMLLIFTLINFKKIKTNQSQTIFYKFTLFSTLLLLFLMSPLMFWDFVPSFLLSLQFPWRLEIILICLLSIISPMGLNIIKNKKTQEYIIVILVYLTIGVGINYLHFHSNNEFRNDNFNWEYAMGWQKEYLPSKTLKNLKYYYDRDAEIKIIKGHGEITIHQDNISLFSFSVKKNSDEDMVVELPRLYYLGYKIKNSAGNIIEYNEDENGFITILIDENGLYSMQYGVGLLDRFIKLQSLIVLSFLSYFLIRKNSNVNNSYLC